MAVPEAEAAVGAFRNRHDPSAPAGVPAHITVLYPFLVGPDLDDAEPRLRAMFAATPAFAYRLARADRFSDVVWLAPTPPDPFRSLTAAVAAAWPEAPPYGGVHDDVIPHLTVARGDDTELLRRVEEEVAVRLPIAARADRVLLMESDDGYRRTRAVYPLRGEAGTTTD